MSGRKLRTAYRLHNNEPNAKQDREGVSNHLRQRHGPSAVSEQPKSIGEATGEPHVDDESRYNE
jgi:hypothetical protein